jgi:hypothetical protein
MFYDTIETASQDDEVEVVNTRLWELYTNDCQHRGLTPSLKDYLVWVEEEYQS